MGGLYENVRKDCRTKKDVRIYVAMGVLICVFAVLAVLVVWFLGYHGRFTEFVGKFSDSTVYAYNNDSLIADVDGKTFKVSEENMYGIFGYLSLNKSGRESKKIPEGEPVTLDYGNGTMLKLWDMPTGERHHDLFIQYTDAEGYVYSYVSYTTTLETVVIRYLTYGNDEIIR